MDHLKGIKIVSFNHFLMGPVGIQFLADLGADVIAIEPIDGAFQRKWGGANRNIDGQTMLQLTGNRNKRSFALNLKSPEGITIARKLIAGADVVALLPAHPLEVEPVQMHFGRLPAVGAGAVVGLLGLADGLHVLRGSVEAHDWEGYRRGR